MTTHKVGDVAQVDEFALEFAHRLEHSKSRSDVAQKVINQILDQHSGASARRVNLLAAVLRFPEAIAAIQENPLRIFKKIAFFKRQIREPFFLHPMHNHYPELIALLRGALFLKVPEHAVRPQPSAAPAKAETTPVPGA